MISECWSLWPFDWRGPVLSDFFITLHWGTLCLLGKSALRAFDEKTRWCRVLYADCSDCHGGLVYEDM